jgi:hypothetical protein
VWAYVSATHTHTVSGAADGCVRVWDVASAQTLRTLRANVRASAATTAVHAHTSAPALAALAAGVNDDEEIGRCMQVCVRACVHCCVYTCARAGVQESTSNTGALTIGADDDVVCAVRVVMQP